MRSALLKNPLPYLAILLCTTIWAVNTVVVKITLGHVPVTSLLFLRFFIASLLLSPLLFRYLRGKNLIKKDHLLLIVATALLWIVVNNALAYTGLHYTTAIEASILTLSMPVLSVLFGWWYLREGIYKINLIGIVFGLVGAGIIIGMPSFSSQTDSSRLLGNLLIFLSGISVIAGFVFTKKAMHYYPVLIVTILSFFIGALAFFPFAVADYVHNPTWIRQLTPMDFAGMAFTACFATACNYLLYTWALKRTKLSQAMLFDYIQPGITASLAIPLLHESISSTFLIGSLLIAVGVYWGTLGKKEPPAPSHKAHHL